jgi:hypothetical protein
MVESSPRSFRDSTNYCGFSTRSDHAEYLKTAEPPTLPLAESLGMTWNSARSPSCRARHEQESLRYTYFSNDGCLLNGGLGTSPEGFCTVTSSNSSDGTTNDTTGVVPPGVKLNGFVFRTGKGAV